MRGILHIAYKLLVNDRAKYAALLVGITFAVFLMIEMTSLFAGILLRASATVINVGASIWVMDPAIQTVANGAAGAVTNSTSRLFPSNGKEWSAGANLTAPLFEGGSLWFKRKAAIEDYRQSMDLYRQTVLAAIEQVADVLRGLDHDAAILLADDKALSSAAEALHLVQVNYDSGIATYLDLLIADIQYRQAKIADLQAIAVRYQDTVALFAALGGGWWSTPRADAGAAAPKVN